jgi:hypothetical protein
VRDLREAFFAARSFHSLDDLNAQLDAWMRAPAHREHRFQGIVNTDSAAS